MIRFRDWKLTGSIDACQADHKTIVFTVTGLPKEYFKWELIWVFGSYVDILPLTLNAEGDIASKVFERENLPFAGFYTAQLRGHNRAGGTRHTDEIVVKVGGTYSEDVKFPTLPNSFAAYMDALNLHEGNIENPHKTTAAQVGARPDTWLPTVAEIGAAPAGYGLGGTGAVRYIDSLSEIDNLKANGWYTVWSNNVLEIDGIIFKSAILKVDMYNEHHGYQTIKPLGGVLTIERTCFDDVWQPWEWDSPPLIYGKEYRTTRRHNGKGVYAQAVYMGALPNNGATHIELVHCAVQARPNFALVEYVYRVDFQNYKLVNPTKTHPTDTGNIFWGVVNPGFQWHAYVKTDSDYSSATAVGEIWYTVD